MEYTTNVAPQRVLDMRKAWATGDAIRDAGLTEPKSIEQFKDISYRPYDTWNLLDLYLPKNPAPGLPVIVSQMACILTNKEYAKLFNLQLPADVTLRAVSLACGLYSFPTSAEVKEEGIFSDYFGDVSLLDDPHVKVLEHITADYPPAFVFSEYCDSLYEACEPMAKLITERGGTAECRIYGAPDKPEISHVFHVNMKLAEGERAKAEFFRSRIVGK